MASDLHYGFEINEFYHLPKTVQFQMKYLILFILVYITCNCLEKISNISKGTNAYIAIYNINLHFLIQYSIHNKITFKL